MDIQVCVPAALGALHNFMHSQEPDAYFLEIDDTEEDWNLVRDMEEEVNEEALCHLGDGLTTVAERQWVEALRDHIAEEMWVDYQHVLQEQGML